MSRDGNVFHTVKILCASEADAILIMDFIVRQRGYKNKSKTATTLALRAIKRGFGAELGTEPITF